MRHNLADSPILFALLGAVIALFSTAVRPCDALSGEDVAQRAYELRMNGQTGQAGALLEEAVKEDPGLAEVQYELSRTNLHMGLARPQDIFNWLERAHRAIKEATTAEPDNLVYRMFSARVAFIRAYAAMGQNDPAAADRVEALIQAYQEILRLRPGDEMAHLHLVEIYQTIPEEFGGNPTQAAEHAAMLESASAHARARAQALLLPEDEDLVAFWKKHVAEDGENIDFLEELGRAHLYEGQSEQGAKLYRQVVSLDPSRFGLLLDLGRHYGLAGWQDEARRKELLPLANAAIDEYLEHDPIQPMRAFTLGVQSRVASMLGDEDRAGDLSQEAEGLDSYHSKATGVPAADLFVPLGEVSGAHFYLFRPY